ncbi:MAG: hypothetical protein R8K48_03905 [Gallionella sp.]
MTDLEEVLPLLTEVENDALSQELPTLTEIVTLAVEAVNSGTSNVAISLNEPHTKQVLAVNTEQLTPKKKLNPEEMHQLLQQLEGHLESVFTRKLNTQLDQLQRLAVDLAVSEFKAELPRLLRDALNNIKHSRLDLSD